MHGRGRTVEGEGYMMRESGKGSGTNQSSSIIFFQNRSSSYSVLSDQTCSIQLWNVLWRGPSPE